MALTRKDLYRISGIISIILSIILFIVCICELLKYGYFGLSNTGKGMVVGVGENKIIGYTCLAFGVFNLIAGTLMLIAVKYYKKKRYKSLIFASSFFTLLGGVFANLNAIALYLAFSTDDKRRVVLKMQNQVQNENVEKLQLKIKLLRNILDKGEISNEEFLSLFFDLLNGKD